MRKQEISNLLQRYLSTQQEGKNAYFDVEEIEALLDSFEESEDYTYYDEVLALGLRLHPGNPDLQVRLCRSYLDNEDYDSALALIDSIADTENQDLDMLRLECYVMQDSYEKVIEHIEKLIASNCEYLEALFEYIAPILGDMDMIKEAHDFISRGLMLFPNNLILKDELCYNLEVEGNIKEAIIVCNELIDKNPYSYDSWFTLGRLYTINKEYEKAIEAFDFALACDDSDDELKIMKAFCLQMNGNYETAIEIYNDLMANEEFRIRIMPRLTDCYIQIEDYKKAYLLLNEQIKQNGQLQDVNMYIHYIRCCFEMGKEKEVSEMLVQASKLFPQDIRIYSLLALSFLDKGNESKTDEITEYLFTLFDHKKNGQEEDIEYLYQTAQILFIKGNMDKSLQYYNKVLELDPQRPFLHLQIAMIYLLKRDMVHFAQHFKNTHPEEILDYMKNAYSIIHKELGENINNKFIPPENLVKEFLKNKDNNN